MSEETQALERLLHIARHDPSQKLREQATRALRAIYQSTVAEAPDEVFLRLAQALCTEYVWKPE